VPPSSALDSAELSAAESEAASDAPASPPPSSANTTAMSPNSTHFPTTAPPPTPVKHVLAPEHGKGLSIKNSFARRGNVLWMDLVFENASQMTLNNFAIKFNINYLGVIPAGPLKLNPLMPGQSQSFSLPLTESSDAKMMGGTSPVGVVQMAIKTELGVAYFQDTLEAFFLFDDNGRVEKANYIPVWKSIADAKEIKREIPNRTQSDIAAIRARLCAHNIHYVAATNVAAKGTLLYFSFNFKGVVMLLELTVNGPSTSVIIKSENPALSQIALNSVVSLLTS